MGELSQKVFLQWLQIILSESLEKNFSIDNNDTERCFSANILSKSFINLQITLNIELVNVLDNVSEFVYVLCYSRRRWELKILQPKQSSTKKIADHYSTSISENAFADKGFSQAKIVLISFCGTILALFFVVVLIMRTRNYLKRRTKLYRDTLSPGIPVIYQDFDLNPTSHKRYRPYYCEMQRTRHPHTYKREINIPIKPSNFYIPKCKDPGLSQKCKLPESINYHNNPRNCSLRPLITSCNLMELKRNIIPDTVKECPLEPNSSGIQSACTKRRRHSLVDQIESVMNKHFDYNGVSKTWSNENLKTKSINHHNLFSYRSGTISKSGTRSNMKLPYRFRKAISLRRRLSVEEIPQMNKKTQSYHQNINAIS